MQRIIEDVPCALCHAPAQRQALRQRTDGFMYDCPACGGRYSIGTGALSNVAKAPGTLLEEVRRHIANGDLPRIAFTASEWQQPEVIGRQAED